MSTGSNLGSRPRAKAFLIYGQSGDPASARFVNQAELYARKAWRTVLFDAEAVNVELGDRFIDFAGQQEFAAMAVDGARILGLGREGGEQEEESPPDSSIARRAPGG